MTISRSQRIETIFNNFHAIKRTYADSSRFSNRHFGVTMTQASVLMILFHQGRHTMTQLAAAIGVSKSAASQLLDGLIEQNFVTRSQDEQDRRIAYVELTSRGKRHLKHVRGRGMGKIMEVFDLLDDQELAQIEAITTKLANARPSKDQVNS
ncbi:MAG: MarR family transcriptional regulator [Candidatus Saccharimonas sp.]